MRLMIARMLNLLQCRAGGKTTILMYILAGITAACFIASILCIFADGLPQIEWSENSDGERVANIASEDMGRVTAGAVLAGVSLVTAPITAGYFGKISKVGSWNHLIPVMFFLILLFCMATPVLVLRGQNAAIYCCILFFGAMASALIFWLPYYLTDSSENGDRDFTKLFCSGGEPHEETGPAESNASVGNAGNVPNVPTGTGQRSDPDRPTGAVQMTTLQTRPVDQNLRAIEQRLARAIGELNQLAGRNGNRSIADWKVALDAKKRRVESLRILASDIRAGNLRPNEVITERETSA